MENIITNTGWLTFDQVELVNGNSFDYPVMKITNELNGRSGYLMPFRNSFFQVSGNKSGECDMGSGDANPEHLKWIAISNNSEYLLKIEICRCLNAYLNTSYGDLGINVAFTLDFIPWVTKGMEEWSIPRRVAKGKKPFDGFFKLEDIPQIDEFVNETLKSIIKYYKLDTKVS